ncbi:c-type cytochrome [Flavitalea sp. BT771]|uniref:c-type cytochrome n=1 Tax=Flavitalea sp. BT771 TaxID=3063329 RepID=UPI0026E25ACD|nr:c-type cytochrome [Flavitalea sp. BT771]MDO6434409.1 c-type cytochrome [Flavitalea sp. BT771]MDV6223309.1 c-type cytochrome [Flavitalea sp. BT771]
MIHHRPIVKTFIFSILLSSLVSMGNTGYAQDATKGKTLFQTNCASCHSPVKQVLGPALKGVTERVPDKKLLHDWIKNNSKVLQSGNPYFTALYAQFNKAAMNTFPNLSDADIDDILKYVETYQAPTATPGEGTPTQKEEGDNTLLYGILTLILAIIMMVLLQVNSSLKKLSDDKEGIPAHEPIPFYRNKVYITFVILILFILGGYWVVQGAIGLGRTKNYQPVQPIFYSHKVHAGINQISCLYCHTNAWESKHATVPSLNVCMNCHAAINDYTKGPKLYREDGSEVNGTDEIQKLYSYTGYDPKTQRYSNAASAKPVEWVKIHSLPDHVYFNHSQHIRAGKVQCQTCHGPIQEMDEVKQFADLSMGWCINCHRTTKVNFGDSTGNGNKFYSIYEKFHKDLKTGKMDSVTVENIGGTECQKCHY